MAASAWGSTEARPAPLPQMSLRTGRGKLHGQLSFIDLAGSEKGSDVAENEKKVRAFPRRRVVSILRRCSTAQGRLTEAE